MAAPITVADFKARFARDFTYGSTDETVKDGDIQTAIDDAAGLYNAELFSEELGKIAYLLLTAHLLVLNLRSAGGLGSIKGGMNSQADGAMESKSVGQVSASIAFPDSVKNNAVLSAFLQTNYGQRYVQILYPRIIGNVTAVAGWDDVGVPADGQQ